MAQVYQLRGWQGAANGGNGDICFSMTGSARAGGEAGAVATAVTDATAVTEAQTVGGWTAAAR